MATLHSAPMRAAMSLLLGTLLACTSWQAQQGAPQDLWKAEQPNAIRVTRTDGNRLILSAPALRGDTLVGVQRHGAATDTTAVAIPFADIRQLEVRRFDPAKTIVLAAGLSLAGVVAIAGAGCCGPEFKHTDSMASSPLVYSWDGHTWRLDSGTFAGAITAGAARTDVDNLIHAVPEGRRLRLRVTNELRETDSRAAVAVLALDHDSAVTVAPDGAGRLYPVGPLLPAVRATDLAGRDVSEAVDQADGIGWESVITGRDSTTPPDLVDGVELTFLRGRSSRARLVVDAQNTPWAPAMLSALVALHGDATQAWYDSLDSDPRQLRRLATLMARDGFLQVSLWAGGRWIAQGSLPAPGPELAKRQVVPLDLTGLAGDTVRIRLTSTPSFWWIDQAALDTSEAGPVTATRIQPVAARTDQGNDVLPVLGTADGRMYTIETGEGAELSFEVPSVSAGKTRSYLLQSTGWYRIRTPAEGPADMALLDRLLDEPGAAARFSVGRMNRVVAAALAQR